MSLTCSDHEVKVTNVEKKFWLKFLDAKQDLGELCCPMKALILVIISCHLLISSSGGQRFS